MNKPNPLAIAASTLLLLAFGAAPMTGCSSDDGSRTVRDSQLDVGTADADATTTPPQDTDSGDDTAVDTSDGADADTSQDVEPDVDDTVEVALAQGIDLVEIQAFQTIETKLVEAGAQADSDIPLIAGRETLFRLSVVPQAGWTAREVSAEIVLFDASGAEVSTLSDTRTITEASSASVRDSAFEIRVPGDLLTPQTSASFRLTGQGTVGIDDPAPSPARWPRDGSAMALGASDATGTLHLVIVPFRYDTDDSGRLPDTSPEQLALFENGLRAIYPSHELLLEVREPISWTSHVDWGDFNRELRALKQADGADEAYYYGVIRPAETFEEYCNGSCTTGQSFTVSSAESTSYRVGSGVGFGGERWAWTLIHELGHMHGRGHAPCGVSWWSEDHSYPYGDGTLGVWGWDSRTDTLFAPQDATDFMGYCDDLWASDYTYMGLVERMKEAHALTQPLSLPPQSTWQYVNWSDSEAPSWGRTTQERDPSTGEWATADFVDAQGNTVEQVQVPLIHYAHGGERSVLVPEAPRGAERVAIATPAKNFTLELP